ncbi:MAG TPA: hypothetical protein VGD54_10655, partial [Steroidobacteraceae bacterium]
MALFALSARMEAGWAADTAVTPNGQLVTAVWQHHQVSFSYYGITTLYSCDGLETNIRLLLLHLGARKDAKVNANGCPNGSSVPGPNAIIHADFFTLSPSPDSNAPDAVKAQWSPVEVSRRRPSFIGEGDCELINEMKDLITKNFSLRDVTYRTDCIPRQVVLDGFSITAQALKPIA